MAQWQYSTKQYAAIHYCFAKYNHHIYGNGNRHQWMQWHGTDNHCGEAENIQ